MAHEFLNRAYRLNMAIENKKKKVEYFRELSCSVSSPGFEEKFQGTRNTDAPFVRYLGKIDALEREIDADMVRLATIKDEIINEINKLDNHSEILILTYRYIYFMSISQIASKMYYSERWTKRLHKKALESFSISHP